MGGGTWLYSPGMSTLLGHRRARLCIGFIVLGAAGAWGAGGCSAASDDPGGGGSGPGAGGSGGSSSGSLTTVGNGVGGGLTMNCPGGGTTSLSGIVLAPTPPQFGPADPIYNALVYVPTTEVAPFQPGVECQNCGAPASGNPIATALTDATGAFTLTGVPSGADIPLVIQIGRWRRQVTIPAVAPCEDTPLPAELTRLPRNKQEGDIPKIAIASSPYDSEECILRKIGIEDAEFTAPSGEGRVHIYQGNGATIPGTLPMSDLWSSLDTLRQYDMVLFPCSSVPSGDAAAMTNVFDYANAGGRVFATDLSYPWYTQGPAPFPSTAQWTTWGGIGVDPLPSLIDQSFPKGAALAEWLQYIGATTTLGQIDLHETYHVVDGVNAPTTRWLYSTSPATVQTLSFNTPVGLPPEQQCGRAVYSNFHIANGYVSSGTVFPAGCNAEPLTAQERVLEFMLFDLASCVQDDQDPPEPPQ